MPKYTQAYVLGCLYGGRQFIRASQRRAKARIYAATTNLGLARLGENGLASRNGVKRKALGETQF